MALAEGRKGKITVQHTSSTAKHTVAELGTWSISGQSRNMIEATAFGDTVMKHRPGMLDPGTLSFSGFFDGSDSTGQVQLLTSLSSGASIDNTTTRTLHHLRLWANDDTSFESYGYWSVEASSGEIFITGYDVGTDKNGIATVNISAKISKGAIGWSTST